MERKLVTIRKIDNIVDIPNADNIVLAKVDGWNAVVQRNEFSIGDYCVYFEIDSFLPSDDPRFDFLHKNGLKTLNDKKGVRVKTIKLRGVVSQGLIIPVNKFPEILEYIENNNLTLEQCFIDRICFSEIVNVVKYEVPENLSCPESAGEFPFWIHKTDQERIQNIFTSLKEKYYDTNFYATLKMDGSSATVSYVTNEIYLNDKLGVDEDGGQLVVCSKDMLFKTDNTETSWLSAVKRQGIDKKIKKQHFDTGRTLAFQGELVGPGIQKNAEKFKHYSILMFSIYDVDNQKYLPYDEFCNICDQYEILTVPTLEIMKPFERFNTVEDFIEYSDNLTPVYGDVPEGVVYHSTADDAVSFKAISNKYLLK